MSGGRLIIATFLPFGISFIAPAVVVPAGGIIAAVIGSTVVVGARRLFPLRSIRLRLGAR